VKYKLIAILLTLLLLNICPQLYAARHQTTSPKNNRFILQENVETIFTVKFGKLFPAKGDTETCKYDNLFVVEAFREHDIEISNLEYSVTVQKIVTVFKQKSTNNNLICYPYFIKFRTNAGNKKLIKFINNLKPDHWIFSDIATIEPYGMPNGCHYFLAGQQLVLLTYYGFPEYYIKFDPKILINYIIKLHSSK
jgi:hypothetical protein